MRIKVLLITAILAGLFLSLSASAQVSCENPKTDRICKSLDVQPISYNKDIFIPRFDPTKGELLSVKITAQTCGWIETEVSSEDKSPRLYTIIAKGISQTTLPTGDVLISTFGTSDAGIKVQLCADDEEGPADWAGCDYVKLENGTPSNPICSVIDEDSTWEYSKEAGDDLSEFISSGSQTTWAVNVDATGDAYTPGSLAREISGEGEMGSTVCVEYTYCPPRDYCINGSKVGCDNEPLSGWTITLTKPDGSTDTRTTDANGEYSFCGLKAGSYKVSEETRPDWYPVGPTSYDVQLPDLDSETGNAEDINFKNTQHFCITGYKYNVTNNAEDPLKDWKITLTKPDGSTVTDTTDDNGYYEFCDLANGQYKVSEELKTGWIAKSPASVNVELYCENESVDFRNAKQPNLVCVCPFFIRNELYGASCKEVKVVDASKGVISNDPPGSVVLNPESISIDPKYGTLFVEEDGSFVYDPTVATGRLYSGLYVMFKYNANNGLCDSVYPGIAKIQLRC